jgi:hypothetical protein
MHCETLTPYRPRARIARAIILLSAGALLAACSEPSGPTMPGNSVSENANRTNGSNVTLGNNGRQRDFFFTMSDDCDSATFNARNGPGTCIGGGRTTFDQFVAQLQAFQFAPLWRFEPPSAEVHRNTVLVAKNIGAEVHTFTHVQNFGGGIVPLLNQLTNNPIETPECKALGAGDMVAPGDSFELSTHRVHAREMKIQCCIHPWMRTVVELGP